mmetsp:Transcript_13691/g.31076  ORF Transcript_13691/g.31076 Transcript_13691/m.31076 type:complete len:315 (-) Transcript_13691:430-1374(-)
MLLRGMTPRLVLLMFVSCPPHAAHSLGPLPTPPRCPSLAASSRTSPPVMDGGVDGDAWADSLRNRIEQVREGLANVQVVVIESIVPGQRLSLTAPPQLVELFTANSAGSRIIMLGRQGVHVARFGVEVTLEKMTPRPVVPGIHPEGTADLTLRAGRLCEVVELLDGGVTSLWLGRGGRARWVSLDGEGAEGAAPLDAPLLERSEALEAMVVEWVELVRESGEPHAIRQLAATLDDLGPIPPSPLASRRAVWVAGLINPPAVQGRRTEALAADVRPGVLMARTAEERVSCVERALLASTRSLRRKAEGRSGESPP